MERSTVPHRVRSAAHVRRAAVLIAGLTLFVTAAAASAAQPPASAWPSLQKQLETDHVIPGSALEKLTAEKRELGMRGREEAPDPRRIPLWLRVLWRKNHPTDHYLAHDPTGGYPLVIHEIYEWMLSHQDLQPGQHAPGGGPIFKAASETGEQRISGAQTAPRSETTIRVNRNNTQPIIGPSNNISSSRPQ